MQNPETEKPIKPTKKRGPEPKSAEDKREKRVSIYLTDVEYAELLKRVKSKRELSVYARHQLFAGKKAYCVSVPEINLQAYRELGQAASNLNQIARKLNASNIIDLDKLQDVLTAFRLALIEEPTK